jgi:hypothetical protein
MTNSYLVGAYTGRSAGFSPLRITIDVAGHLPVRHTSGVGDQPAPFGELRDAVDGRQPMTGRKRDDQIAMNASVLDVSGRHSAYAQ